MTRIAALNDFAYGSSDEEDAGPTREALEAEASKNYNQAIRHLASRNFDQAYDQFCFVLQNPFIEKACWPEGVEPGGVLPQDLALRYSCLKNLGNLASKRGEYDQSVDYYMEAARVDRTEVTLWHRLGASAIKLRDFELALVAFQEGYNVNPKHWPCLDQLLSVLFILKMYTDCLGLATHALQRDPGYIKALAFKDKIFEIQPSLKEDVKFFFKDSSVLFKTVDYNKTQGEKFIATCEGLRPPNKTPRPPPPIPQQRIRKPLGDLTWENLAQSLLSTYDALMDDDGMAFAGKIDICEALNRVKNKHLEKDMEDLGVAPLDMGGPFERKDHLDVREKNGERDRSSVDSLQGNPIRIAGRRRTIELGESQDSFRVSEKRRSLDSDTSRPEDTKSDDGAVGPLQGDNGKEEVKDHSKEKEAEKDGGRTAESEKDVNKASDADCVESRSGIGKVKRKDEDKVRADEAEAAKENSQRGDEVNRGSPSEEASETKKTEDVGKVNLGRVLNAEASVVNRNGVSIADMPAFDLESDNDFQGFTNAAAYKERHMKLVQGKNALNVIDEEDFATEQSDEGQDAEYVGKDDYQEPGGRTDVGPIDEEQNKASVDNSGTKPDAQKDPADAVGEEENIEGSYPSALEGNDIENRKVLDSAKGRGENDEGIDVDKDENEGLPADDEVEEDVYGEQPVNEDDKIEEEAVVQEEDQENVEGDIEGNGIEHMEDDVGDREIGGIEDNEGAIEEREERETEENDNMGVEENEVELEENEGVGMEENEGVMEENEGVMEENEDGIEENEEGDLGENEGYQEVEEGMDDEGMLGPEVTETEAAVNALKGIMALQPTEILGLPEPDFDYENEYVEYFDGGVYEEDDDDLVHHQMDQGEEEEEEEEGQEMVEDIQEVDESPENAEQETDAEQECGNVEEIHRGDSSQEDEEETRDGEEDGNQQGEGNLEETQTDQEQQNGDAGGGGDQAKEATLETGKQVENKSESDGNEEKNKGVSNKGGTFNENQDTANKKSNAGAKRDTSEDNTTTEASDKAEELPSRANVEVARKSKRTKRGLERELEQLDYWGRRQERDAKRRRRTISSKLLGGIEEAEYLTWADLLRSFVPAVLLTVSGQYKKKKAEEKSESDSVCPTETETKVQTPSVATADFNGPSNNEDPKDAVMANGHHSEKDTDIAEAASLRDAKSTSGPEKTRAEGEPRVAEAKSPDWERRASIDASLAVDKREEQLDEKVSHQSDMLKQQREETIFSSSSTEEAQVQAFLMQYEDNGGILHLLQQFLKILMKRHKFVWPPSAAKMFTQVYPRVRNHVLHGSPLNLKESYRRLRDESLLALTHWELCCSIHQASKLNTPVSESNSASNPFSGNPSHLEEDIFRLILMLGRGDIWVEDTPQFHTRLRWLQAQIRLIRGQQEEAVSYLELLLADLDRLSDEGKEYVCNRVRIESDNVVVSNSEVKRQLNVMQRSHMLEQVVDHYTDGRYRVVADLLTTIFHEPLPKSRPGITLPTRQTQLAILVDSLYKLSECKDVIYWGSFSLTEALMRYNRAEAEEEKNRWAKTLMKITETMNVMLTNSIDIVRDVNRERLVEVVSTLIRMLVVQLEKPQSTHLLPFETLTPWMLLHRILAHEENLQDAGESKKVANALLEVVGQMGAFKTTDGATTEKGLETMGNISKGDGFSANASDSQVTTASGDQKLGKMSETTIKESETPAASKGPMTPYPSTLFLITAHDELGKHSWCCYDEGTFLLYCVDVLLVELRRSLDDQHRQLLHHTLEQVTFCLYSHPSKKSKHKHLRDHGVPQIAFCWERAMQLYQYYRPNVLPDFQTSQIPSITDDAAVLFKRIIALLPDEAKPANQTSGVEAYINGEVTECNYAPFSPPTDIISDCFYLLGDYYFKSKEWMNAIKYYKLDLSINHERLESWAPLGLAMKAMLESQLNSCEVIEDEEAFFSLAKAAVQCLRQALKLDRYHTNLWVEFGGLVYMVHSHASRLLKQDLNPDISLETFDMLEKFKNEMLNLAENCFTKALSIQEDGYEDEGLPDERWLHCYMLGKVAEKKSNSPQVIVQYYTKAAHYLHNIRAKYPSRINYNSPQEFSVEALEMYYRIHAFILKYLHQREGRDVEPEVMDVFIKCLDEVAAGPFSNSQEKKYAGVAEIDIISDTYLDNGSSQKKRPLEDQGAAEPPAKKLQSDVVLEDSTGADEKHKEIDGNNEQDSEISKEGDAQGAKASSEKEKKESDDEIQVVEEKVVEKKDHYVAISRCLSALRMCLSRFQEHYKTMYRLAHYYHTSKFHKDNNKAQNYLLGCQLWQNVGYMPVNGLFNERKVWIQQPKNSNFFHGVWRIPNDEIDRPGSFAAHMYRCVSLILDILPQMKDFFMILQIALALKNSPDKDKKYLRDNERELLSEHATQVGLQAMKDKFKVLFKSSPLVPGNRHLRFLLDVYKCYKQVSKHLPGSEPHFAKMLTDAYASYRSIKVENRSIVLREADSFCNRHQYMQHRAAATNNPVRNLLGNAGSGPQAHAVARRGRPPLTGRGRPPLTGRGRGRGRGSVYSTTNRTVGDMLAVQQAYKIYESLISTQTLLNKKELSQPQVYSYQKQLEGYQSQLMKYLQIPCVSHYFQASLQGLGTTSTKLPPPKPGASSNTNAASAGRGSGDTGSSVSPVKPAPGSAVTSVAASQGSSAMASKISTTQANQRPSTSLSALAARSQVHGISITSVSASKGPNAQSQPLKPNMSVTVSPVKSTCPPSLQGRDISLVSVSQTSPGQTSVTASKTLTIPSSTTFKPVSTSSGSTTFKPNVSLAVPKAATTTAGSTTFKAVTSAVGSTTFQPVTTSSASTTFKASTSSGGSTTFKPSASSSSSVSSVPKLPAGTTLTRPREISPAKVSGPRPQLQANARPISSTNPSENVTVKKIISQMSSNSTPVSKASDSSSMGRSNAALVNKQPTLPKDMTITPAPRIKTLTRQPITPSRPVTSPTTSFFRAFEASLGLTSNKSLPENSAASVTPRGGSSAGSRSVGQGQGPPSSLSSSPARVTQLSTQELLHLAYGSDGRGQPSGGRGQTSVSRGQSSRGRGQTPGGISSYSSQYPKSSPQQRVQTKPPSTSPHAQGSNLLRIQSSLQTSGSQQQLASPQQSRTTSQTGNLSQPKPVSKPNPPKPLNPPKPPQKPSASSDDIITLD